MLSRNGLLSRHHSRRRFSTSDAVILDIADASFVGREPHRRQWDTPKSHPSGNHCDGPVRARVAVIQEAAVSQVRLNLSSRLAFPQLPAPTLLVIHGPDTMRCILGGPRMVSLSPICPVPTEPHPFSTLAALFGTVVADAMLFRGSCVSGHGPAESSSLRSYCGYASDIGGGKHPCLCHCEKPTIHPYLCSLCCCSPFPPPWIPILSFSSFLDAHTSLGIRSHGSVLHRLLAVCVCE
jgi:hypothetical protein